MTKLFLGGLSVAAFLYAVYLLLMRKRLPEPSAARGWKRKFLLATSMFAVFLTGTLLYKSPPPPRRYAPCYMKVVHPYEEIPETYPFTEEGLGFAETMRYVWQRMNEEDAEPFAAAAEEAVKDGAMRRRVAKILTNAHAKLAFHKMKDHVSCYEITVSTALEMNSNQTLLKQIETLRELQVKGTIDNATAEKAFAVIARELEALQRLSALWEGERNTSRDEQALVDDYEAGGIVPGDTAVVAAKLVLAMESVPLPASATPAVRLKTMKTRVFDLLKKGPSGNDWRDPFIHPNVNALLQESILQRDARLPYVTCYLRATGPVKERSEELKQLQKKLLDKSVRAGVLDVEVAEKAKAATEQEAAPDYALEMEIQAYQKTVRRTMRMLFKHGEVPPSFVREVERAIDAEIIRFHSEKALRHEIGWHLVVLLRQPEREEILSALAERTLIPPVRTHRRVMTPVGKEALPLREGKRKQIEEFLALVDGEAPITLPGDAENEIPAWMLPKTNRAYILKMRRVCRALLGSFLVRDARLFAPIDEVLGIPVVGKIQKEPSK